MKRGLLRTGAIAKALPLSFGAGIDEVGIGRSVLVEVVARSWKVIIGATFNFFLARLDFGSEGAGCRCDFLLWISIFGVIRAAANH